MAFGEQFQGMSDREILIEVALRQNEVVSDVAELKEQVGNIHCPSPKCHDHEQRIRKLEDHERIVAGVVCLGVLGSGLLVWLLTKLFGG